LRTSSSFFSRGLKEKRFNETMSLVFQNHLYLIIGGEEEEEEEEEEKMKEKIPLNRKTWRARLFSFLSKSLQSGCCL